MDDIIIKAVRERIELGTSKDVIIAELRERGYEQTESEHYYKLAQEKISEIPPAPVPASVDDEKGASATDGEQSQSEVAAPTPAPVVTTTPKKKLSVVLPGIILGLLVGLLVVAGLWLYTNESFSFRALLGTAPYSTPDELLIGVSQSALALGQEPQSMFSYSVEVELQPVAPGEDVPVLEALVDPVEDITGSFGDGGMMPDEGHMRFYLDGVIDTTDAEVSEFSMDGSVDMLLEPLVFSAAGSMRLVDKKLYGKMDDLPAMMRPAYEAEAVAPLGSWMLIAGEEDLGGAFSPGLLLDATGVEAPIDGYLTMAGSLFETLSDLQAPGMSQLAQLGQLDLENRIDQLQLASLLTEHPPIKIVGDPERVVGEAEVLYRYHLTLDIMNLEQLLLKLPDVLTEEARMELTMNGLLDLDSVIEDVIDDLPTQSEVDAFSQYAQVYVVVTTDGDLRGWQVEGEMTDRADSTGKAVLLASFMVSPTSGVSIVAPAVDNTESLAAAMQRRQIERRNEMRDASIEMTLSTARVDAELYYNENSFSYAGVCTSLREELLSFDRVISDCVDAAGTYRATAALSDGMLYCVDSTGFADTVSSSTDLTKMVTCQ